jgi:hypothetical protein
MGDVSDKIPAELAKELRTLAHDLQCARRASRFFQM